MCVNGTWQEVVIDDYLPVDSTGRLVFGSSKPMLDGRAVLWVSLIEKAWAKLNGNYDRTIMGTVDLGFIHLCGVPSVGYKHLEYRSNKEVLWQHLQQAMHNQHIMTAGTSDESKDVDQLLKSGLIANHCYSILEVQAVKQANKVERLLRLRNPWSR